MSIPQKEIDEFLVWCSGKIGGDDYSEWEEFRIWAYLYRSARLSELAGAEYSICLSLVEIASDLGVSVDEAAVFVSHLSMGGPLIAPYSWEDGQDGVVRRRYVPIRPSEVRAYYEQVYYNWRGPKPTPLPEPKRGFVYLLKAENGTYKIGRTVDLRGRMKSLLNIGVEIPLTVEFVCAIEDDDYVALEKELHRQFAMSRVAGEWFALGKADVKYIKSLATCHEWPLRSAPAPLPCPPQSA